MEMILKNMNINEVGIGSNYHTLDNDPIDRFIDPRIDVEIFPDSSNNTSTNISCDLLGYNSGLRTFSTEQEARHYAGQVYDKLVMMMDNTLKERVILRLLSL